MDTFLSRVAQETYKYKNAEHAAIDHLKMAHTHLFEATEGRDIKGLLSGIGKLISKLEKQIPAE